MVLVTIRIQCLLGEFSQEIWGNQTQDGKISTDS